MRGFQIRKLLTDLAEIYFRHRGKPYTRVAVALITIGGLAATTSVGVLVVQAVTQAAHLPGDSTPWWATTAFGGVAVAAGVAIFLYHYPRDANPHPLPPDQFNLSLPPGITFGQAAVLVGMHAQHPVQLEGFAPEELSAVLAEAKLRGRSAVDALARLGALSVAAPIGAYEVFDEGGPIIVRRQ